MIDTLSPTQPFRLGATERRPLMADMPTKHLLQPGAQARSSGAAQLIPELPAGLDPALAQRVAAAWEYLAPSQRELLLQLARQIDEAEAKVALLEREAQRQ